MPVTDLFRIFCLPIFYYKNVKIEIYFYILWPLMGSHIKERTQIEGVWEHCAEEDIRTWEEVTRGWRKLHSKSKKSTKLSRYTLWRRLGGGRKYSPYSFLASALDGGEWSASHPNRTLPPCKGPPVPIGQEAGWAPEPVWTQRKKSSASVGDRTPAIQSVVSHCTDRATPAPKLHTKKLHDLYSSPNIKYWSHQWWNRRSM
jgi:hypothetical protein